VKGVAVSVGNNLPDLVPIKSVWRRKWHIAIAYVADKMQSCWITCEYAEG